MSCVTDSPLPQTPKDMNQSILKEFIPNTYFRIKKHDHNIAHSLILHIWISPRMLLQTNLISDKGKDEGLTKILQEEYNRQH